MALKQESKVLTLSQGDPERDVKLVVKNEIVEFRRSNNDSLLLVMHKDECFALVQEFFPSALIAP